MGPILNKAHSSANGVICILFYFLLRVSIYSLSVVVVAAAVGHSQFLDLESGWRYSLLKYSLESLKRKTRNMTY